MLSPQPSALVPRTGGDIVTGIMTPDDRNLLSALRRQQEELQQALESLNARLGELEARARADDAVADISLSLPPLPVEEPVLPPIPAHTGNEAAELLFPPIPVEPIHHPLPPLPPNARGPKPSFEFQVGRWFTRIGALFLILALVSFAAWADVTWHIHERMGAIGKLGIMAIVSLAVIALGARLERKKGALLFFGRTLIATGLAGIYFTTYAGYFYGPLLLLRSPLTGGFLLVLWALYVLLIAERRQSQLLGLFAIILAYVSTAINPIDSFTMAADLILAAAAVVFLWRNGWAVLSAFSMAGTYLALLRRLVVDDNGEIILDTSRTLPFWPHAIYLYCAWLIFTAAVILTKVPTFRGGKRIAFLSFNNAAMAGLLALTAHIAGYGASSIGWTLLDTGLVFLIVSRIAGFTEIDPVDVMGAYAAQGLALLTGGIMVVYTGITRGVLLLIETFLLGVAGAFAGDRILTISTYVSAFFATLVLIWEIAVNAHHPLLLGFSGAAVMLIIAWNSRSEVRDSPVARSTIVVSTSCYCIMAVGLIYTALSTRLDDSTLPVALALATLVLTFAIYQVALYELPPIAQTLLLAAQFLVLFPAETGETLPWWSSAWAAAITLLLVTWWARQRITRTGSWTRLLTFIYAFALVGLAYQTFRPYLSAQGWMIGASLLSVVFLAYGALSRTWAVAAAGQVFLALALYHFFLPPNAEIFPWTWWAAAVPVMVVFATGRAAHKWLELFGEIPDSFRKPFGQLAYVYKLIALAALIRWVFGVVSPSDQVAAFLLLGTFVLSWNVRHPDSFGVRCSFVLSLMGAGVYVNNFGTQAAAMSTYLNGLAMLLLIAQPALLRHEGKALVSEVESWLLILLAVATSWLFVSAWVWIHFSTGYFTVGWALFALFLFLFGQIVQEPRLRWCGLGVVIAAILRVCFYDIWGLSVSFRFVTLGFMALILFGIGYIILRRATPSQMGSSPGET
jgi:hypothetical protein